MTERKKTISFSTDDRTIKRLCELQQRVGADDFGELFQRAVMMMDVTSRRVLNGKEVWIGDPSTGAVEEDISFIVMGIGPDG